MIHKIKSLCLNRFLLNPRSSIANFSYQALWALASWWLVCLFSVSWMDCFQYHAWWQPVCQLDTSGLLYGLTSTSPLLSSEAIISTFIKMEVIVFYYWLQLSALINSLWIYRTQGSNSHACWKIGLLSTLWFIKHLNSSWFNEIYEKVCMASFEVTQMLR